MNRANANSGVNLPALRSHNAALVLDLLRRAGPDGISRSELAARTGLTPQAVSKITARLRAEGLAVDAGRRASTGGKPATALRLVPGARSAVGLHLDRDELTAVLTDLTGAPLAVRTVPFDLGGEAEGVVETAAAEVRTLLDEAGAAGRARGAGGAGDAGGGGCAGGGGAGGGAPYGGAPYGPVLGVGVACPGPLDHEAGVLHRVTGLPRWDGYPLRDALAERLSLAVVLDKDTNAAALGLVFAAVEGSGCGAGTADDSGASTSAGVGAPGSGSGGSSSEGVVAEARAGGSFAYLHLGTGLGAGLVLGGALYRGSRTGAGEFGHQVIQLDGPVCECGDRGCLEALCLAAVTRGDTAEAARVLGTGAANLAGLLDIDRVLLGGRTVLAAPDVFVRGVGDVLAARARRAGGPGGAVRRVPVGVVPAGARTVADGAARLILAPLFGHGDALGRPGQ